MEPTDTSRSDYFHRVVDCQWACPAHTDVPEYIRLIAQGEFTAAYMVNRESNVFPGILGRVCDRPCEPACRRGRIEEKPVAICRLKRVASDHRDDITALLPTAPREKNGKRVACIGPGPAYLTVANVGEGVVMIGVGTPGRDCCASWLRLGDKDVKVRARKPRQFFKAAEWELEDAEHENIAIVINHAPKFFVTEGGRLLGMMFEKLEYDIDDGDIKATRSLGDVFFPCDDVILAIGQENAFPWIEKGIGIELDKWNVPKVDKITYQSTRPKVFFGGDAAFGPKNIIWSVEHGHQAAISIHKFCQDEAVEERMPRGVTLSSRKMGMHEIGRAHV